MTRRSDLLIPPKRIVPRSGSFSWPRSPVLASATTADVLGLSQLADDLRRRIGLTPHIVRDAFGPAALRVRRDKDVAGPEQYRMEIIPSGIEIYASTDAGAYYALATLRELLALHGRRLPACAIEDWPDFRRRGIYHDCSRGKVPTLATLKAMVERLARWKINELQLYVENVFTFHRHPAIGRGYSPFTPSEILELQEHCKRHHVRLVGSLASFGHMEKVLCLPPYRHLGELPGHGDWAGGTTLCPIDPGSIKLLEELYEEFVPLFEAEDFNICGDEPWELGQGRSKKAAQRVGVGRVYLDFLRKIHRLCLTHGKRTNAWADIVLDHPEILGDLPHEMVMLNWDYSPDGARIRRTGEIVEAGLAVVVCPGTNAWLSHGSRLATAVENVAAFAAQGRKCGAEGLLNTDWGDYGHRNTLGVSLHGFAHGAAHAWNGKAVDDATFTKTFCRHVFDRHDGGLAKAVRLLGDTYRAVDDRHGAIYTSFAKPLLPSEGLNTLLYRTSPSGWQKVIGQLGDASIWPEPGEGMDRFEALALREFALAAEMDVLAARRAIIGRNLLEGRAVPRASLAKLSDDLHAMASRFRSLWSARNKPSRLCDNMAAFRNAEAESRRLARK